MFSELFFRFFSFFQPVSSIGACQTIITGIGNKGRQYIGTRHNIGFMVIDEIEKKLSGKKIFYKFNSRIAVGTLDNRPIMLVWPRTYVNRSGVALAQLLKQCAVPASNCLVAVDDFNLPLGTIRLRQNGSHGGHNGLKSLVQHIGDQFPRLRIGIGPLPGQCSIIDFVLGQFTETESKQLHSVLQRATMAAECYSAQGIQSAMSKYNG